MVVVVVLAIYNLFIPPQNPLFQHTHRGGCLVLVTGWSLEFEISFCGLRGASFWILQKEGGPKHTHKGSYNQEG